MIECVTIDTTCGKIAPKPMDELSLEDILVINRLPPSLFQAYLNAPDVASKPIPIDTRLRDVPAEDKVVLRCIMNPNFSQILEQRTLRQCVAGAVTTVQELQYQDGGCQRVVYEVDEALARGLVSREVAAFVHEQSRAERLLVGVSGGGDSNALLGSLQEALTSLAGPRELIAFTLMLDPVWPESSIKRASALCQRYGVQHMLINSSRMAEILDMKTRPEAFYEAFLARYGDNTAHFFGTFVISAVARRLCRKIGTDEYCLGFNREDVLAEMLFSLMNGRRPLPFPVRRFGATKLLMPVWQVPKVVLDACYPEFSQQNYDERDTTTRQRGLIYFLAHGIDGMYGNLGLSLLRGVQQAFAGGWSELAHHERFDLYTEPFVSDAELRRTQEFLEQHFHALSPFERQC